MTLAGAQFADPAVTAPEVRLVLLAIAYLLTKHAIADYFLQTRFQWRNKGIYGHPGGLLHGALHAALTAPVFLILPAATTGLALLILGGEFLVHYHIDWAKERFVMARGLTPQGAWFWHAIGVDQLLHGLTYVAIVWVLAAR